jgi:tetratricopeptide (TPR) repeat protein
MPGGRFWAGVALCAVAAAGCDTLSARHRASNAADYYKAGDYKSAMLQYEQAVALDPSIDILHWDLAVTYVQVYGQSPKSTDGVAYGGLAVRAFEEYLRRCPDDKAARDYLVQTFVDTRRYDDAVAWFKPDIEHDPPSIEAISTLGQIAAKTNRIDEAIDWSEERVQANKQDPDGPYNLGVLIWDYLHQHAEVAGFQRVRLADRAVMALRASITLRPHFSDGYAYLNLVYREKALGETDEAWRTVEFAEADRLLQIAKDLKAGKPVPPLPPLPTVLQLPDGGAP